MSHEQYTLGTILSEVIEEYAPVVSHHQSKSLPVTKSLNELSRNCLRSQAIKEQL